MGTLTLRILNLGLRFATLGTRFLFIFFLAKYLDPSNVGYFGIFTVTVTYVLFLVGLDFYVYVSREIIKTPANNRGRLLKGQAAVSGGLYIILLPLAIILLYKSDWPGDLVWWFLPILILEHLNQEVSRLLAALSQQLTSSIILFVRQGSWCLAAIVMMSLDPNTHSLGFVMPLWAVAGVSAFILGVWKLKQLNTQGWRLPINWVWVKKGIGVSVTFLLATLALRGLLTFDRYWLEELGGVELVAGYVLMQGVASGLMIFLESVLFAFAYPELIKCNHEGKYKESRKIVRHLFVQTIFFSAVFGVISWMLLPYFLSWIDNPIYQLAVPLFPFVLSAVVINGLGLVAHYALYARGYDRPIIYSNICSLLIFVVTTWLFSRTYGSLAVPIGLNAAYICILAWQSIAYIQLIKNEK
jgi:O-antigen/teichoic acid export membrane protein